MNAYALKTLLLLAWLFLGWIGGHMAILKKWPAVVLYLAVFLTAAVTELALAALMLIWIYDFFWLLRFDGSQQRHFPSDKLGELMAKFGAQHRAADEVAAPSVSAPAPVAVTPASSPTRAKFFIELPCLPLADVDKAIELSEKINERIPLVMSSHICVNEEGEEVSVLMAADELDLTDSALLDVLQRISVREEVPVVLYTAAKPSLRKGFWPEEEDQWIEQERDLDFWEQHLEPLLSLEQSTKAKSLDASPGGDYYIEFPSLPLSELNRAESWATEIRDRGLPIIATHMCINEEGEELSVLLGVAEPIAGDDSALDVLKEIALREDVPVVLYDKATPSCRTGFWPDEEDEWITQRRDFDFWTEHLPQLIALQSPAKSEMAAPEVPLSQLLEKIQEDFEDTFIELEEPWRENFFSQYMEDASAMSLGIGLFEANEREFGISVHMFLEDWDTSEPISIETAGFTGEAGGGSAIAEVMERLPKVAFSDVQSIAENAEKRDPPAFPEEIAAVFRGEASPFKYCGCKLYWNDELVSI